MTKCIELGIILYISFDYRSRLCCLLLFVINISELLFHNICFSVLFPLIYRWTHVTFCFPTLTIYFSILRTLSFSITFSVPLPSPPMTSQSRWSFTRAARCSASLTTSLGVWASRPPCQVQVPRSSSTTPSCRTLGPTSAWSTTSQTEGGATSASLGSLFWVTCWHIFSLLNVKKIQKSL